MNYINDPEIKKIIKQSLKEDIGRGDITTKKLLEKDTKAKAAIYAKEKGVICGMDLVKLVFKSCDNKIKFLPLVKDGNIINKGMILAKIYGEASSILSSERVALNFLGFLSGIATRTQQFVKRIKSYNVKIMDTRKTIPALRKLQRYAVKIGGGMNHRLRLDEMVLVKDNHIKAISYSMLHRHRQELSAISIKNIISRIKRKIPKKIKIEIEVKNLREFKEALKAKPDIIMLDNMKITDVKKAVQLRSNLTPKLEASGNINLKNIVAYAASGIDFISLGTLTKDIKSLDLSLKIEKKRT